MKEALLVALKGAATGGLAALIGYMKQEELGISWKVVFTKKFWNTFDPIKALKTVIIGMIVGAISVTFGYTYNDLVDFGVMTLIVYGVDALTKLIVRRTPIVRAWNWLKEKATSVFTS